MTPAHGRDERPLLRLDLLRHHWLAYAYVTIVTLLVHAAWLHRFGIAPSTDFGVRYDPGARELLSWLGLGGLDQPDPSQLGAYGWSRLGYIAFVGLGYYFFGPGLASVVYPQLAFVWLVYPLMLHVLLHVTGRRSLSVAAMSVWLTFFDGYQWHFWGLPDAIYRCMFVAAFFLLLRLWETGRDAAFIWTSMVAVVFGSLFRVETALYAVPALGRAAIVMRRRQPVAMTGLLLVLLAAVVGARGFLVGLGQVFVGLQVKGWVLPGSGYDVPGLTSISTPGDGAPWEWVLFFGRLFTMRLWYAVTPLPALWSTTHRIYYAAYVLPAYALALVGTLGACRRRDTVFLICLWIYLAGILLQGLVAVDPSMRYAYTSTVFLFFSATMGWPAARRALSPVFGGLR